MPQIDKASDPNLTEEAYARSTGKAVIRAPGSVMDFEVYLARAIRFQAAVYPNRPWGCVGDRQKFYDLWEENVYLPWMKECMAWQEWIEGYLVWRKKQQKQINAGNNGAQLGAREFTFTYGNQYDSPEDAKRAMETAIDRLTRYYKHEIIEFHAVGEYTKAGRPHVHGWYWLDGGKKITDKNFKRAYPPWNPKKKLGRGFEGGHHATIERVSDFHGYTEKHLQEAWLIRDITNANDSTPPSSPRRILEVQHVQVPTCSDNETPPAEEDNESSSQDCQDRDAEEL